MATGPAGERFSHDERMAEVLSRHSSGDPVHIRRVPTKLRKIVPAQLPQSLDHGTRARGHLAESCSWGHIATLTGHHLFIHRRIHAFGYGTPPNT